MGAGTTSTVGGLSQGPRDTVGGNTATMWGQGYCRCPGLGAGGFALKRVVLS